MTKLEQVNYIYEKADGVTYARKFGSTDRIVIGYDHDLIQSRKEQAEIELWAEIREAAKTNKTLQKALDRVKVIYRLSKDDPL